MSSINSDNDALVFISALLRGNSKDRRWFKSSNVDHKVFGSDQKYAKWLIDYEKKAGVFPSVREFEKRFDTKLPNTNEAPKAAFQTVLELHMFTSMSKLFEDAQNNLQSGTSISEVWAKLKETAAATETYDSNTLNYVDFFDGASAVDSYRKKVEMSEAIENGTLILPDWPWPTMNELLDYSEFGEFIVFAARTSIGKTWIALFLALYWASKGFDVVFYSLENPKNKITARAACIEFDLAYKSFRRGTLTPKEVARLNKRSRETKGRKLKIVDLPELRSLTTTALKQDIQRKNPQIVVVDGAYLLKSSDYKRINNMSDQGGSVSKELVSMAKTEEVLMIATVQMNRDAEDDIKGKKAPANGPRKLKKVFGSDQWAQDADNMVIFSGSPLDNFREVSVDKGRESGVASFNINFYVNPPVFAEITDPNHKVNQTVENKDVVEFKTFDMPS